jgi:glucan 1,3-beta-glucosidase
MGIIQSETPYMQSNPDALAGGFSVNPTYFDPEFTECTTEGCKKAWGLRIYASSDILVYGAGLYSFFDNYDQTCLATESCQENMVSIECSSDIYLWALSTKASTNMVTIDGKGVVPQADNRDNFCSTIAFFEEVGS